MDVDIGAVKLKHDDSCIRFIYWGYDGDDKRMMHGTA